ncbi:MAG TPA: 6-phosphofructokinase [Lacunisphaera sp.]|nr:6-phosphofructokinase [Lacunisphaera sp.]
MMNLSPTSRETGGQAHDDSRQRGATPKFRASPALQRALYEDSPMGMEVMGRYAGWLALHAGIGGRADAILLPEIPYDAAKVAEHIKRRTAGRDRHYAIVVVAEGAKPVGGGMVLKEAAVSGRAERLGGIGDVVAGELRALTGKETRSVVLGHVLRGVQPTALDRSLGLIFGAAAVRAPAAGHEGVMVAVNPPRIDHMPLKVATARLKLVTPGDYGLMAARTLGISFGD